MNRPDGTLPTGEAVPDSIDAVMAMVRARGGRSTASRRALLDVLFETDDHLTAEALAAAVQQRLQDVHLSTIYRNLEELEKLGVVTHAHLGHGPVVYQLASHAHAHFVCNRCGTRVGVDDDLFAQLADQAEARHGFTIDPHHFAVFGLCASCRAEG